MKNRIFSSEQQRYSFLMRNFNTTRCTIRKPHLRTSIQFSSWPCPHQNPYYTIHLKVACLNDCGHVWVQDNAAFGITQIPCTIQHKYCGNMHCKSCTQMISCIQFLFNLWERNSHSVGVYSHLLVSMIMNIWPMKRLGRTCIGSGRFERE